MIENMVTKISGKPTETNSVTVVVLTDAQNIYRESRFEYENEDGMLLAMEVLAQMANETVGNWTHVVIHFHNA